MQTPLSMRLLLGPTKGSNRIDTWTEIDWHLHTKPQLNIELGFLGGLLAVFAIAIAMGGDLGELEDGPSKFEVGDDPCIHHPNILRIVVIDLRQSTNVRID